MPTVSAFMRISPDIISVNSRKGVFSSDFSSPVAAGTADAARSIATLISVFSDMLSTSSNGPSFSCECFS